MIFLTPFNTSSSSHTLSFCSFFPHNLFVDETVVRPIVFQSLDVVACIPCRFKNLTYISCKTMVRSRILITFNFNRFREDFFIRGGLFHGNNHCWAVFLFMTLTGTDIHCFSPLLFLWGLENDNILILSLLLLY